MFQYRAVEIMTQKIYEDEGVTGVRIPEVVKTFLFIIKSCMFTAIQIVATQLFWCSRYSFNKHPGSHCTGKTANGRIKFPFRENNWNLEICPKQSKMLCISYFEKLLSLLLSAPPPPRTHTHKVCYVCYDRYIHKTVANHSNQHRDI